jgi:phosphocarrier protein
MQSFNHTLNCVGGLHARPAGAIVNAAKQFSSDVLIRKISAEGVKEADAKRLISLMSLGARKGETLTFYINGPDENDAAEHLRGVCRESVG